MSERHMAFLAILMLAASFASAGPEGSAKLSIGDPAPALKVDQWVKGESVDPAKSGQAVLIEFWATWCGPCIDSIPHLTRLQRDYGSKGLRVVGFTAEDPSNSLDSVRDLVARQKDRLGYAIAFEKGDSTTQAWLEASGEMGLPSAFLVDRTGRLAWIGHPMELDHDVIERVLAGQFDVQIARRKREVNQQAIQAAASFDWDKFKEHMSELSKIDPQDEAPYMALCWVNAEFLNDPAQARSAAEKAIELSASQPRKLARIAGTLARPEDPHGFNALARQAIDRAAAAAPEEPEVLIARFDVLSALGQHDEAAACAEKAVQRLKGNGYELASLAMRLAAPDSPSRCHTVALQAIDQAIAAEPEEAAHLETKFHVLWTCRQDQAAARAVGLYYIDKVTEAPSLNNFSWMLLTEEDTAGKFNDLALASAEKCHQLSGGKNWMFLDTLALAKFENGRIEEAVEFEGKAIELCPPGHPAKADLEAALRRFQGGR